jgi:hypothetical protein
MIVAQQFRGCVKTHRWKEERLAQEGESKLENGESSVEEDGTEEEG